MHSKVVKTEKFDWPSVRRALERARDEHASGVMYQARWGSGGEVSFKIVGNKGKERTGQGQGGNKEAVSMAEIPSGETFPLRKTTEEELELGQAAQKRPARQAERDWGNSNEVY